MKTFIKPGVRPAILHVESAPDQPLLLRVTRHSDVTGKDNSMDLPITEDLLRDWTDTNRLIQEVMPHLTAEQREFLISGCTPEEWAKSVLGAEE